MIKKITRIVILIGVLLWIGWDIYAYFAEDNSTISVVITGWAHKYPILPLAVGVLMGHWFWQNNHGPE